MEVTLTYKAVKGSRFSDQDAQIIGTWKDALGNATARQMVEAATPSESPVHSYFEWDNEKCGQLHREDQARHMARSIVTAMLGKSGEEREVLAFPSVTVTLEKKDDEDPRNDQELRQYVSCYVVREDPDLSSKVRQDALNSLLSWKRKYEDYLDVYPDFGDTFQLVFDAIQDMELRA